MKILWGSLVVAGSGKVGGHVATKNRAGSALRTKVKPSNPQSIAQSSVRSRLTSISQAWAGLTDSQREAWNSAVVNYAKSNVFGNKVHPSGFNLYQRLNNELVNIGQPMISVPPLPEAVYAATSLAVTAVNATGVVTATFAPAIPATDSVKVLATAAISPGRSFVKSQFRQIGVLTSADASPKALTALYAAKFGSVGAVGQKIYFKFVGVNETTGQAGQAIQAVAVIS